MIDQSPTYYARMAASLGDKARMLEHLPERASTVLEIGAGDGALSALAASRPGVASVTALDPAPTALDRIGAEHPEVRRLRGTAAEVPVLVPAGSVDAVLASSVLHKAYSYPSHGVYPDPVTRAGTLEAAMSVFTAAAHALADGGVLVLRDFVAPSRPGALAQLKLAGSDHPDRRFSVETALQYLADRPEHLLDAAASRHGAGAQELRFLVQPGMRRLVGSRAALWEFCLTATWGPGSWAREVLEHHAAFTASRVEAFARAAGLVRAHRQIYTVPGYHEHLAGALLLDHAGRRAEWPETTGLWVFTKRPA